MFYINPEEYEVQEESAEQNIHYEISDALEQISFLENRYRERIKAVEHRRKRLLWTVGIYGGTGIGCILLAVIFATVAYPPFGDFAVVLFGGLSIAAILGAIGAVWSLCVHKEIIPSRRVYTLYKEEQACKNVLKELERNREDLQAFLDSEKSEQATLDEMLKEIILHLYEDEKHADFLFGEGEKI